MVSLPPDPKRFDRAAKLSLWREYVRGQRQDEQLRNRLLTLDLPFLTRVTLRFLNKNPGIASFEDLYQEGFLGYSRAADKFDPDRGFVFLTYANYYAWSYMQKHVRRMDHLTIYHRREGNAPTLTSLDALLAQSGQSDVLADPRARADEVETQDLVRMIHQACAGLSRQDADIVRKRVVDGWKYTELALLYGLSKQRIKQRYDRALESLRRRCTRSAG